MELIGPSSPQRVCETRRRCQPPDLFDDVEELIVDGAHVLFADVGDCPWAEPGAGTGRNGGF